MPHTNVVCSVLCGFPDDRIPMIDLLRSLIARKLFIHLIKQCMTIAVKRKARHDSWLPKTLAFSLRGSSEQDRTEKDRAKTLDIGCG